MTTAHPVPAALLVIWLPVGLVLDGVIVAAWWRWM